MQDSVEDNSSPFNPVEGEVIPNDQDAVFFLKQIGVFGDQAGLRETGCAVDRSIQLVQKTVGPTDGIPADVINDFFQIALGRRKIGNDGLFFHFMPDLSLFIRSECSVPRLPLFLDCSASSNFW